MQFALFAGLILLVAVGIALVIRSSRRGTTEESRALLARRARWTAKNRPWLGLATGGSLIALTGAGMWVHAMLGETVDVELSRLEAGEESDATFLRVHGFARAEFAVCRETRGVQECHTPLTSTPNGTAVAVLLSSGAPREGELEIAGMAWSEQVWGLEEIETRGLLPTPNAFVLLAGETPEERRPVSLVMLLAGLIVGVVGAAVLRRDPWPR